MVEEGKAAAEGCYEAKFLCTALRIPEMMSSKARNFE